MRCSRGFTLVELIVAVGITAILAGVLLAIVNSTLGWWGRTASALAMENEATLVMERLTTDLESAFSRRDGGQWIALTAIEQRTEQLQFFANVTSTSGDSADPTTVRELSYVVRDGVVYRYERSALDTMQRSFVWSDWATEPNPESFLLASGVEALELAFYDRDQNVIETPSAENWPARVRVALTLISEDGQRRRDAVAAGVSTEALDQITNQTARRYVRWIGIQGVSW